MAGGADGLTIEVHPRPEEALSDGDQSLLPEDFARVAQGLRRFAGVCNRTW
jgi:3-deoxy-7-phosphoheptulonate synthase